MNLRQSLYNRLYETCRRISLILQQSEINRWGILLKNWKYTIKAKLLLKIKNYRMKKNILQENKSIKETKPVLFDKEWDRSLEIEAEQMGITVQELLEKIVANYFFSKK